MRKSEKIDELAKALNAAQQQMKGAVKDATNPFFKSKYATLESVWEACGAALAKNGLSVAQAVGFIPEAGPTLTTTLLHASGQWIEGEQPLAAKGLTPQELGSAISYARRYGLSAMLGIVQEDDDGEGAQRVAPQAAHKPQGATSERNTTGGLSVKQIDLLRAVYAQSGMPSEEFARILIAHKANSIEDLRWQSFNNVLDAVKKYKK